MYLAAVLAASPARAETFDYSRDEQFASTSVEPAGTRITVGEVLRLIEQRTEFTFVYASNQVPLDKVLVLTATGRTSLATIFDALSRQHGVVFTRINGKIAIRQKRDDDIVIAAPLTATTASTSAPTGGADEVIMLDALIVQGEVARNSVVADRQQAAVSVDLITADQFGKFVATDITDVIVRLPGVSTTSQGNFAVIRGLAERYNPIMLDGLVLPSSDPERQTPELDLFPARLVDAVVVSKAFEPRLPATATGGAVDLRTKPVPDGRFVQIQIGVRADEGALNNEEFRSSGYNGTKEFFGLGSAIRPGALTSDNTPAADVAQQRFFANPDTRIGGTSKEYPIGTKFSVVAEDRIDLGGEGRALGYSFSFGYDSSASSEEGRKLSIDDGIFGTSAGSSGRISEHGSFSGEDYAKYEQEVAVGGLATLGYAFNRHHILGFSVFLSQVGIDTSESITNGFSTLAGFDSLDEIYAAIDSQDFEALRNTQDDDGALSGSEALYYRERNLTDFKLTGSHEFDQGEGTELTWSLARILASQEEPDYSILPYTYGIRPRRGLQYTARFGTPERTYTRYWRETEEATWAGRADTEKRFDMGWMENVVGSLGTYLEDTERTFTESSFFISGNGSSNGSSLEDLIDQIAEDIQTDIDNGTAPPPNGERGVGNIRPNADASRELTAVYANLRLPLLERQPAIHKLEFSAGARLEDYKFQSSGFGKLGEESIGGFYSVLNNIYNQDFKTDPSNLLDQVFTGGIDETTIHPALALVYSPIANLNLRLSYSQTVARPSFRETGPYFTTDEVLDEIQAGNVNLKTSEVDNFDLRIEYFFPDSRDLIALSLFAKQIDDPIERVSVTGFSSLPSVGTWTNNPNTADIAGVELEIAKNLGFMGELGEYFAVGGNFTYIEGSVERNPDFERQQLNPVNGAGVVDNRSLVDQPEWIGNAYISFDHRPVGFSATLSYFAISDVLQSVNVNSWDTYTKSYDRVDLALTQRLGKQWRVRLTARNITDPERKYIGDPNATTEEATYRTFRDGRSYSLTVIYDF